MTLHYRKLLVASLLFPLVVLGAVALLGPSLMEARSSAAFTRMRANTRSLEHLVEIVSLTNTDAALEQPISELQEGVQRQYDGLVDFREAVLSEAERRQSGGWLPLLTAVAAMLGTLSSVVLSWRADMREVRAQQPPAAPATEDAPRREAA
jgi:hypothetical protein